MTLHPNRIKPNGNRLNGDTSQDLTEAAKWYRKAAEQGDEIAEHNLGRIETKTLECHSEQE